MSDKQRSADAEVILKLSFSLASGRSTGYRPHYALRADYQTSVVHEFIDKESVPPGGEVAALVWFLTPEVYTNALWVGQTLDVSEGARIIGEARITRIFNPVLARDGRNA